MVFKMTFYDVRLFCVRSEGNSIFPQETDFFGYFVQILHFMMDFREKIESGDPIYAIFASKMFGKGKNPPVFKQKYRKSF